MEALRYSHHIFIPGVEITYDLYNPTIQSIEVLKLQKTEDDDLRYLRDSFPKYSEVPLDMEAVPLPKTDPIPVNKQKVW